MGSGEMASAFLTFLKRVVRRPQLRLGRPSDHGQLGRLAEADPGGEHFLACGLYARAGQLSTPVYVHAKVGIVDDRWLTIGSANPNEGSHFQDTEVNVVTDDEQCQWRPDWQPPINGTKQERQPQSCSIWLRAGKEEIPT